MTLIKSISGIRGTIGGSPGDNLTPLDVIKFTAAFGTWIKAKNAGKKCKVIVGRDARVSGEMVNQLVDGTLTGLGIHVINLDFASTPTVEIAVTEHSADGGLIITASHNPAHWNALKLLNHYGEFLSDADGKEILMLAEKEAFEFSSVDELGIITTDTSMNDLHISKILNHPLIDISAIKAAEFRIAIDCVNSVGGIILPALIKQLGAAEVMELYCTPNGRFPHNPEPIPENLKDISKLVDESDAHLGFVVDPDVDRLSIICEDGSMFGEEYTLVAIADYILQHKKGNTVSNLSSTRALRDITEQQGGKYFASAVGEVNVVKLMKQQNAIIGGEGNGGVIFPELHYGRDALIGIALFLTWLAKSGKSCSQLRASYPDYYISKNKIQLTPGINVDKILVAIKEKYKHNPVNDVDGIRIDFEKEKEWVHLRKSNTEPIIRIYAESGNVEKANSLAEKIMTEIKQLI